MAPRGPRSESYELGAKAFTLRSCKFTWEAIAKQLGYESAQGARSAAARHLARNPPDSDEMTVRSLIEGVRIQGARLTGRFTQAVNEGDDTAAVAYSRELHHNHDQEARLTGSYQPERIAVAVGDAEAQAAEIKQLLRELLADPNSRAQLYRDAGLPVLDAEVVPEPPEAESWSNIGDPSYTGHPVPVALPEPEQPPPAAPEQAEHPEPEPWAQLAPRERRDAELAAVAEFEPELPPAVPGPQLHAERRSAPAPTKDLEPPPAPPLSRRLSHGRPAGPMGREYDPLRGVDFGRRPINGW
jgi:hypothetical protein